MRRTLIIATIVIILLGGGAAAYYYFFMKPASVTVAPTSSGNETGSDTSSFPVTGDSTQTGVTEPTGTSAAPIVAPASAPARLTKISAGPVVLGEVLTNKKATASSTAEVSVGYIERQSGNVYTYMVHAGTLTRTSNKTVPGIQDAVWLPNASLAFVRYLSNDLTTINSYALSSTGSGGFFLPQGLSGIAVSSSSVLTLASGVNGSVASLSRADGTHTSELFTTPLTALHVSFAGKNQYLVYTNPSATLAGAAFLVDASGHFSRVVGPLTGLVAKASPSGKWVLESHTSNGSLQMTLINTVTGESLQLPIGTIVDKCVWAADESSVYCGVPMNPPAGAGYPDDWYQGAISFTDRIWKIQVAGRYAQLVLDFSKENDGAALDAESLAIDPLGTTLVFVNKIDGSLWSYSL